MNGDRLRVYASFDASRSKNPAVTDLKYYFLLRAWLRSGRLADGFVDVHDTTASGPRRFASRGELEAELRRRLESSDLLLLILSERSASSGGWLAWEIEEGAGRLALPVLCAYAGLPLAIDASRGHRPWWPRALARVREARPALHVRHVPFQARALAAVASVAA